MGSLGVALLAAGIVATGHAVVRASGWATPSRFTTVGVAILSGLSVTMIVLYLPLAITGRVVFWPAYALHAAALIGSIPWALRAWPTLHRVRASGAVLVIALAVLAAVDVARSSPFAGYDAKAIYGLKAKALLYERDLQGALFQDAEVVHYHGDYPLGLPLLMALAGHAAEGSPEDSAGGFPADSASEWVQRHDAINAYVPMATLWLLGYLGLVAGWARHRTSGSTGLLLLVALGMPMALLSPWIVNRSVGWIGADLPLALCLGVVALGLTNRNLGDSHRALIPLVLATAAGVMLKVDALIGVAALATAFAVMTRGRRRWNVLIALGIGLVVGMLPHFVTGRNIAEVRYDERYLAALRDGRLDLWLQRIPDLLLAAWDSLTAWKMSLFWVMVLMLGIPLGWRRGGAARLLAIALVLHLMAVTAIFVVTPNLVTWHVVTALPRVWVQMGIVAGWLLMDAVAQVWGEACGWRVGMTEAVALPQQTA